MGARGQRNQVTQKYHVDTEKKIHYTFNTFNGGTVSGMRAASKRHAEKQSIPESDNYKFIKVTYENGTYLFK